MYSVDSEAADSVDCVMELMDALMETYNIVIKSSKACTGVVMMTNISYGDVRTIVEGMDICDVITVGGVTITRQNK